MAATATLWMGDVETYMDERFISDAFRVMGEEVKQVKLIRNKYTGEQASYCFIDFHTNADAHRAMLKLNGKILPGSEPQRRFKLNSASYGREHLNEPEYSLFVGDLTEDVDDLALYNYFISRYKSCKAAKVVLDSSGKSRGYGFVRFGEESEQKGALSDMHSSTGLGKKPIRVSMATPKSARQWNTMYSQGYTNPSYSSYYNQYANYANYSNYGSYNQQQQNAYNYANYYGNYNNYWQGSYDYYNQDQTQAQAYAQNGTEQAQYDANGEQAMDDDPEEDPELEVDIEKLNKTYFVLSEEFYESMENSRWQPLDSVNSEISRIEYYVYDGYA